MKLSMKGLNALRGQRPREPLLKHNAHCSSAAARFNPFQALEKVPIVETTYTHMENWFINTTFQQLIILLMSQRRLIITFLLFSPAVSVHSDCYTPKYQHTFLIREKLCDRLEEEIFHFTFKVTDEAFCVSYWVVWTQNGSLMSDTDLSFQCLCWWISVSKISFRGQRSKTQREEPKLRLRFLSTNKFNQ